MDNPNAEAEYNLVAIAVLRYADSGMKGSKANERIREDRLDMHAEVAVLSFGMFEHRYQFSEAVKNAVKFANYGHFMVHGQVRLNELALRPEFARAVDSVLEASAAYRVELAEKEAVAEAKRVADDAKLAELLADPEMVALMEKSGTTALLTKGSD